MYLSQFPHFLCLERLVKGHCSLISLHKEKLTDKNDAMQNSQELSVCKLLKKQNKTSKGAKRGPQLIVPHHPTAGQSGRDNIMLCSKFESIHIL